MKSPDSAAFSSHRRKRCRSPRAEPLETSLVLTPGQFKAILDLNMFYMFRLWIVRDGPSTRGVITMHVHPAPEDDRLCPCGALISKNDDSPLCPKCRARVRWLRRTDGRRRHPRREQTH